MRTLAAPLTASALVKRRSAATAKPVAEREKVRRVIGGGSKTLVGGAMLGVLSFAGGGVVGPRLNLTERLVSVLAAATVVFFCCLDTSMSTSWGASMRLNSFL